MNTCYDLEFLDLVGNIKLSETKQEIKHKHVRTSVWLDLKNTWSSGGWLCSAAQSLILAQLGRMGIFADEFVVVMNSGIPCPNDWSNFLWASLKEGKPHVDPSSNFLLWLQCEKEKDLSSKRSSFLWHSRSQNISPTFFHLSQGIERGQIHEKLPWINQQMKSVMRKRSRDEKLQDWLFSLVHPPASFTGNKCQLME